MSKSPQYGLPLSAVPKATRLQIADTLRERVKDFCFSELVALRQFLVDEGGYMADLDCAEVTRFRRQRKDLLRRQLPPNSTPAQWLVSRRTRCLTELANQIDFFLSRLLPAIQERQNILALEATLEELFSQGRQGILNVCTPEQLKYAQAWLKKNCDPPDSGRIEPQVIDEEKFLAFIPTISWGANLSALTQPEEGHGGEEE